MRVVRSSSPTYLRCTRPAPFRLTPIVAVIVSICSLPAQSGAATAVVSACTLTTVRLDQAPKVDNGRISYSMVMAFTRAPENYLSYYEPKQSAVVIDVYGAAITSLVKSFPRSLVFKNMSIENVISPMSLSGEGAHIVIGADPGWQIDATLAARDTMRLTVSRLLSTKPPEPSKDYWKWFLAAGANVAVGLLSWAAIHSLSQSGY